MVVKAIRSFLGYQGNGRTADFAAVSNGAVAAAQRVTSRVVPMRPRRQTSDASEIFTIDPKSFEADKETIALNYRDNVSVIVNMVGLSDQDKVYLFHYMSGLAAGLEGELKRVTATVFLLTPAHVFVSGDENEANVASVASADDSLPSPFASNF
jgi:cell division inhibitor SepF